MATGTKSNSDLVASWIEYASQERTRDFRKYWAHNFTPEDEIQDIILSDPDRAIDIIVIIAKNIENNDELQETLMCGLIDSFEHFNRNKYLELLKKLKDQSIHKYIITTHKA